MPLPPCFLAAAPSWFETTWNTIVDQFNATFIVKDRYQLFLSGFGNTLIIALFAAVIGVLIGILVAVAKVSYAQTTYRSKLLALTMAFFNKICNLYITLFRGTPIVVQLLIMYYIIFRSLSSALIVAILAFGINSGAYVAEIFRAGILSIDHGQTEAGLSLGLSSGATMRLIVLPQAIKNILPALGNEFITLLKETSVAGFITVTELTRAGDLTRSATLQPYFPLLSVAIVYLMLVLGLTKLLEKLERRLRKGDRR